MVHVWENVDGDWVYGPYRISSKHRENTGYPWVVYYKRRPLTQSHGIFEGRMCFAILENAKRRVEERSKKFNL
jgi:hypothetical protein